MLMQKIAVQVLAAILRDGSVVTVRVVLCRLWCSDYAEEAQRSAFAAILRDGSVANC